MASDLTPGPSWGRVRFARKVCVLCIREERQNDDRTRTSFCLRDAFEITKRARIIGTDFFFFLLESAYMLWCVCTTCE